ncbi:MAG: 1-acyl-sn-glycerol-3-phosphate acyltransferase [Bacilli bacterium]|nr:1-acyl-sn-glycerol-3-phosphate acyltransferase [Bacilli bacterium]
MSLILIGLVLGLLIGTGCYFLGMAWWGALVMVLTGLPLAVALMFIIAGISYIFNHKKEYVIKPKKIYGFFIYLAVDFLKILLRFKVKVEGREKVKGLKGYELVINHQAMSDPFILISTLKRLDIGFMIKKEILGLKVIGNWMTMAGYYPIDRSNNRQGLVAMLRAIDAIKNERTIGIFVEGTRSKGPDMGAYRDGSFKMAQKAHSPLVVCVVDDTYKMKKNYPWRRTKVLFKVCKVIPYEEIAELKTNEISDMVRTIMQSALDEYRSEK